MTEEETNQKIIDLMKHLGKSLEEFMVKTFGKDHITENDEIHIIQNGIMNFSSNTAYQIQQSLEKEFQEIFVMNCLKIFTHRFVVENKPKLND